MLDCGSGYTFTEYHIAHVDNPGGAAGTWSLYFGGTDYSDDVIATVVRLCPIVADNGGTVQVTLVWHPANDWTLDGHVR